MTKEVDLFLGEPKSTEKKSTASTTKKEGNSLFDSILANAKESSVKPEKNEISTENKNSKSEKSELQKEAKADAKPDVEIENKSSVTAQKENLSHSTPKEAVLNKEIKETKTGIAEEVKNSESVKSVPKKELSLLDRLVVEAKDVLKDKTGKESIDPLSKQNPALNSKTKEEVSEGKEELKKELKNELNQEPKSSKNIKTDVQDEIKELKKEINKELKNELNQEPKSSKNIKTDVQDEIKELKKEINKELKNEQKESKNQTAELKTAPLANEDSKKSDSKQPQSTTTELKDAEELKEEKESVPLKQRLLDSSESKESKEVNEDIKQTSSKNSVAASEPKTVQSSETLLNSTKNSALDNEIKTDIKLNSNEDVKQSDKNTKVHKQQISQESKPITDSVLTSKETPLKEQDKTILQEEKKLTSENKKNDIKVSTESLDNNEGKNNKGSSEIVKNEKVATQLAALKTEVSNETVNISKNSLTQNPNKDEKPEKLSLLDKLLNESKESMIQKESEKPTPLLSEAKQPKNDILANIYLSSRTKTADDKTLEVKHKGKEQALNAKNVDDVKTSAKTLDIGLKTAEVEVKQTTQTNNSLQDKSLDRLAFSKNVVNEDLNEIDLKSKTISKEASKALTETVVTLNVNTQNTNYITQKIIGARQHMASMMSDIAREMYTNYKPPITAFRLNLQPAHLGSIAIMIKSDKESSISISMNMSNSATLEAINENQTSLRSALTKSFGDENSFSLDFGMQDQKSNDQDTSQEQHQENQKQDNGTTEEILDVISNTQDDNPNNYM